jgi:hypothetical protein
MGFGVVKFANSFNRWPNAVVPYEINDIDFPPGSPLRAEIETAIGTWNHRSCARLIPHAGETDFAEFVAASDSCQSEVGRTGSRQRIGCALANQTFDAGSIMHEIGHCFGLLHEHQRPDRDQFVEIIFPNIVTGKLDQFEIIASGQMFGPYNCDSIMHYSETGFGIVVNGVQQQTIKIKDTVACASIGQHDHLSRGDVATVHAMYGLTVDAVAGLSGTITLGDTSHNGPALAGHDSRLFLAWRGRGDERLNASLSNDGGQTFIGKFVSGETTTDPPALASHNGRLMIAWKGSGNTNLNVAKVDRFLSTGGGEGIEGFSDKVTLGDSSDVGPALASHNGALFIAWRGRGNDKLNLMFSTDNGGSFGRKFVFDGETTSEAPALASHNGDLYLAWKGSGNDNLNVASVLIASDNTGVTGIIGLGDKVTLGETSHSHPGLGSDGGDLFLGWRGEGDEHLNLLPGCATFGIFAQPADAAGTFVAGDTSSDGIAVAALNGRLFTAWKGSGSDNLNVAAVDVIATQSSGLTAVLPARRSGSFLQGNFGGQGNFELVVARGKQLAHYFRDNDANGFPWHGPVTFFDASHASGGGGSVPIPVSPTGLSLVQSNFVVPGNLELAVRLTPTLGDDRLVFFFRDARGWHGPVDIQPDTGAIVGISGPPAMIQSTFGNQGNFELVVPLGKRLAHFFRDNDAPGFPWHGPFVFFDATTQQARSGSVPIPENPTAVALLQGTFNIPGNLELVVRMSPTLGEDRLFSFFRDASGWHGPVAIVADGQPIIGVTGNPTFIQSSFGKKGNFEMVVPLGNRLAHYFRDNDAPGFPWHGPFVFFDSTLHSPRVGAGGPVPAPVPQSPTAVCLLQSNFGTPGHLELVVELSPTLGASHMVFFFRDDGGWHGPFEIVADGSPISGVTAFFT